MKNNETQISNMRCPKLFYLVRKVLGLLIFVFICGIGKAQITISGDAVVVNNDLLNLKSESVYVSEDAFTYNFKTHSSTDKCSKTRKIRTLADRKIKTHTKPFKYKKNPKYESCNFSPLKDLKILLSTSVFKLIFAGSYSDHYKKYFAYMLEEQGGANYNNLLSSKISIKNRCCKIECFSITHQVRPPPLFL